MKTYLTITLTVLVFLSANGQEKKKGFWWKQAGIVTAGLVAGFADGQREVIQHNKWAYRYRHPNANERWWNPDSTWRRANGDSWAGGSVFAFTKDKYHLNQFIRNGMFAGQFAVSFTLWEKPKFKQILLQAAINWGSYALGKGAAHAYYDVFR